MKLLLDTSALIELMRGNSLVAQIVEKSESTSISPISLYEVMVGITDKAKRSKLRHAFTDFAALPFTMQDAVTSANIGLELSGKGKAVNVLDILIAAQAVAHGLTILTGDKDFNHISLANSDVSVIQIGSLVDSRI
ncbi:MAG: type II toxin-antitoxin system VapC family toxin [Candidatus Micrarchaeota archaeon]|nr:type II toxin-antitoxin system VapC family toxin [Candidatus Micrarchaeota archaeon]